MFGQDALQFLTNWQQKKGMIIADPEQKEGDIKSEYLLPTIVDQLIKSGRANVSVLETTDKWFGVTYKEDKPVVVESIKKLIAEGKYPEKLYK